MRRSPGCSSRCRFIPPIIDGDRYFLSSRIQMLRAIRNKIRPEPKLEPLPERMEEAAKAHGVACVISGDVAQALPELPARLVPIGHETVRGVAVEVPIFEYRVAYEAAAPAAASARRRQSEAAQL